MGGGGRRWRRRGKGLVVTPRWAIHYEKCEKVKVNERIVHTCSHFLLASLQPPACGANWLRFHLSSPPLDFSPRCSCRSCTQLYVFLSCFPVSPHFPLVLFHPRCFCRNITKTKTDNSNNHQLPSLIKLAGFHTRNHSQLKEKNPGWFSSCKQLIRFNQIPPPSPRETGEGLKVHDRIASAVQHLLQERVRERDLALSQSAREAAETKKNK